MNRRQPIIFVVNNGGHRYNLAHRHVENAKIVYLTSGSINPTKVDRLAFIMASKLKNAIPEIDYLIPSGSPVLNILAGTIWALHFKKMRMLVFDAKRQDYVSQTVDMKNLLKWISMENGS